MDSTVPPEPEAVQRVVKVRRDYNTWVARETIEDYALRFTPRSFRRWSELRVANTAFGVASVRPDWLNVARTLEVSAWRKAFEVILPAARMLLGEEPPPPSELWERAERALKITASSALLALCAWAYTKGRTPDQDMAWHLLRESLDRLDNEPLGRIMPPLWKWMAQNRTAAESAA